MGSSIGGTVLPIATQHLFAKVGFKWAIRIMAFILAFVVLLGNLVRVFRALTRLPVFILSIATSTPLTAV